MGSFYKVRFSLAEVWESEESEAIKGLKRCIYPLIPPSSLMGSIYTFLGLGASLMALTIGRSPTWMLEIKP